MDIEIKVTRSNGRSQSAVSDISRFSDAYLLMDTVVDVRETSYDSEFVIYIQPQTDVSLKKIELSIDFDPRGAYIFNSGSSSYYKAGVLSADTPVAFSRDYFMAANCDSDSEDRFFFLNMGFTSFERFFTYFTYVPGRVTAVYDLENRSVSAGTILRLESIMIDDSICAGLFLDSLAESIAAKQKIKTDKPEVVIRSMSGIWDGQGTLSRRPESIAAASQMIGSGLKGNKADETLKYVLIDGQWQHGGRYSCVLKADDKTVPGGIERISEIDKEAGFDTGISYAPALISDDSVHFKEYNYRLYNDRNYIPSFSNVYPMNLSSQDVINETTLFIRNAADQWNAGLFKLDHLEALLMRDGEDISTVSYQRDYSVGLFRTFLRKIRSAAGGRLIIGSGVFGECAGITDGIVISSLGSDSVSNSDMHPDNIHKKIRDSVLNVIYRSFYNQKLFRTFSEGIMADIVTVDDDGNSLSRRIDDNEIQMMLIAAAFSGGAISFGSDPAGFSSALRNLFSDALPPSGIVSKPLSYWEYPYCTHTVAVIPDKSVRTEVHVLYNFDEYDDKKGIRMTEPSIFIDMLTGKIISTGRAFIEVNVKAHSAVPVLVKQMPDFPALLWTNENIYRGCMNTSDMYFSDTLIITSDAPAGTAVNIYVPYGRSGDVYVNDKKLRLESLDFSEIGEGTVFTYVQP